LKLTGQTRAAEPIRDWIRNYDAMHALVNRLVSAQAAADADLQRRLGSLCEVMGRRSEARAWFRRAIASNPLDTEVQQALFRLGPPAPPPAGAPEPGRTSVERKHRAAAIRPGLAVGRAARAQPDQSGVDSVALRPYRDTPKGPKPHGFSELPPSYRPCGLAGVRCIYA
jgi:hypothetical protein